jgi:hypothetical protein
MARRSRYADSAVAARLIASIRAASGWTNQRHSPKAWRAVLKMALRSITSDHSSLGSVGVSVLQEAASLVCEDKAEWLNYSTTNPHLRARWRGQKRLLGGTSMVGSGARAPTAGSSDF